MSTSLCSVIMCVNIACTYVTYQLIYMPDVKVYALCVENSLTSIDSTCVHQNKCT